jgi:hypothetical protein
MFKKPIAEQSLSSKSSVPAPNQYDVSDIFSFIKLILVEYNRFKKD